VVTIYLEDTIDVLGAVLALIALVAHRLTGSAIYDAAASIAIGGLLCFIATRLTRRNRQLLTNQAVPGRYVEALRGRLYLTPVEPPSPGGRGLSRPSSGPSPKV